MDDNYPKAVQDKITLASVITELEINTNTIEGGLTYPDQGTNDVSLANPPDSNKLEEAIRKISHVNKRLREISRIVEAVN